MVVVKLRQILEGDGVGVKVITLGFNKTQEVQLILSKLEGDEVETKIPHVQGIFRVDNHI